MLAALRDLDVEGSMTNGVITKGLFGRVMQVHLLFISAGPRICLAYLQRERERERERGHTETVLALVKAGADVQLEFVQGATPLFVCDM